MQQRAIQRFTAVAAVALLGFGALPVVAMAQDADPGRWLAYAQLEGSLRVVGGKVTSLEPWWTDEKANFRLDARFRLTREKHDAYWGRIEFRGTLEGTVVYSGSMQGINTEELRHRTGAECGGAIEAESEVKLQISYRKGTYVLEAHANTKCSANRLSIWTAREGDVDVDLKDDMLFSVSPSFAALIKGFPLPSSGKSFGAGSEMIIVPGGGLQLPFEGFGEWSIGSAPVEVKVKPLAYDNPHCVCRKDVPVEFAAVAEPGGGEFQEFIVESAGTRPEVLTNTGGKSPRLVLKGAGWRTGVTTIRAVYRKGSSTYLSEPYMLEFCDVDTPRLTTSPLNVGGNRFAFGSERPVDFQLTAFTTVWRNEEEYKGELEWTIEPFTRPIFEVEHKAGGARATLRARELPQHNRDFGKKQLVARLTEGACDCASEPLDLVLFFSRDASNNPDGARPNWAYYWAQTSAGVPRASFKPVPAIPASMTQVSLPGFACLGAILEGSQERVIARYEPRDDQIYLLERSEGWVCPRRRDGERDEGIDCFASLLRHENHHRVELTEWWGPRLANYSCAYDLDGDFVPDSVELATPGCNPAVPWSCPTRPAHIGTVWDVELNAYDAGWSWVIGTADREDWSYPGKQAGE
jgi:hypothetical protein